MKQTTEVKTQVQAKTEAVSVHAWANVWSDLVRAIKHAAEIFNLPRARRARKAIAEGFGGFDFRLHYSHFGSRMQSEPEMIVTLDQRACTLTYVDSHGDPATVAIRYDRDKEELYFATEVGERILTEDLAGQILKAFTAAVEEFEQRAVERIAEEAEKGREALFRVPVG